MYLVCVLYKIVLFGYVVKFVGWELCECVYNRRYIKKWLKKLIIYEKFNIVNVNIVLGGGSANRIVLLGCVVKFVGWETCKCVCIRSCWQGERFACWKEGYMRATVNWENFCFLNFQYLWILWIFLKSSFMITVLDIFFSVVEYNLITFFQILFIIHYSKAILMYRGRKLKCFRSWFYLGQHIWAYSDHLEVYFIWWQHTNRKLPYPLEQTSTKQFERVYTAVAFYCLQPCNGGTVCWDSHRLTSLSISINSLV